MGLSAEALRPGSHQQSVRYARLQVRLDRSQLEGCMTRRSILAAGPLALAACRRAEAEYFGRTEPPAAQRLVYLIGAEPATLDPAKSTDLWEGYVVHAMFEGLTTFH